MITFKQFIYLNEAKAKDVLEKYPHLAHLDQSHLSSYGMHLGKITSPNDDPIKIKSAIEAFHKDKNALPADQRDITRYKSVDEIRGSLKPLQQKREAKQDVKVLYNDPKENIQIKHVRTRQACEAGYGGGKTSWCVAASGKGNLFDSYGEGGKRMFTIHHNDKVYGIHEHEDGAIRNEENKDIKDNMHPAVWKAMSKVPELSKVNFMSSNPHVTSEHIDRALDDEDKFVRRAAIKHPNTTPAHISKALNDEDKSVREAAIKHPNATSEHIDKALDDEDPTIHISAIEHPKATLAHISKALDSEDEYVRMVAIEHPKATPAHIDRALGDENPYVRMAAIKHPKATLAHIDRALGDEDEYVREAAIKHPKATPAHIDRALDDEDEYVRGSAIEHPKATPEHISKALNDNHPEVRDAAKARLRAMR